LKQDQIFILGYNLDCYAKTIARDKVMSDTVKKRYASIDNNKEQITVR